ncbi:MAG: 50S ribosomal protein L19 [Candidatus Omnitrophota bacterium]
MNELVQIEKDMLDELKKEFPDFNQGDIVKVYYKIKEKDKERVHPIEGIVLKIQGAMHRKSFTIRRMSFGELYEITFPYYSPNIDKIEVVKSSRRRARRGRIYYIRKRIGKKAFLT